MNLATIIATAIAVCEPIQNLPPDLKDCVCTAQGWECTRTVPEKSIRQLIEEGVIV